VPDLSPGKEASVSALEIAAQLRVEVESLAAQLGTLTPPVAPDEITHVGGKGPIWNAIDGDPVYRYPWRVRAIDDEAGEGNYVYVHHPRTSDPSDYTCLTVTEARRLALALLAACDYVTGTEMHRLRVKREGTA
jgi:hypothetical protein